MKALTIVSSVVFLHVLAFVVLVNGCTPRAFRGQHNPPPASGAPTVGQSQEGDDGVPAVGQSVTEVEPEPVVPTQPEEVEKQEPAADSESTVYVVKKNDSLWLIAKKHKTTVNAICEANGIKKNAILRVGMKLKIPAGKATESSAKPAGTESVNGTNYTVQKGDALSLIARRHGVTVKALKQANNLTSDNIRVGQKLVIPGKAAPAKQKTAPATAPTPDPVAPKTEEQPAVSAEPEVSAEETEEPELGLSEEPLE